MESSRSNKPVNFLALLALLGAGIAVQLASHYYDVRSGMAGFRSFCNLGTKMNCDAVAASAYSELAGGFPLASFAGGWYLSLFVIALLGRNRFWRREVTRFAFLMTSFGLLLSLAYLSIMAFQIHTYCLFCLILDGIALISLLTVLWMKPEGFSQQKLDRQKWTTLLSTLGGCIFVSVLGLKLLDNVSISQSEIEKHVNEVASSPVLPLEINGFPSMGQASAPVTIVEFSDFQCPYCRIGAMVMNTLLERFPAQVRVVFKPFPLDASCNRVITQPMHLAACEAARIAFCAEKQGKFQAVYENFFDHQTQITPGAPIKLATEAGADSAQISACVSGPATNQLLSKSIEEGIQLGVQSTPTFFVNGHRVEGVFPGPFWTQIVEKFAHAH